MASDLPESDCTAWSLFVSNADQRKYLLLWLVMETVPIISWAAIELIASTDS
jgi:hypothetical protein